MLREQIQDLRLNRLSTEPRNYPQTMHHSQLSHLVKYESTKSSSRRLMQTSLRGLKMRRTFSVTSELKHTKTVSCKTNELSISKVTRYSSNSIPTRTKIPCPMQMPKISNYSHQIVTSASTEGSSAHSSTRSRNPRAQTSAVLPPTLHKSRRRQLPSLNYLK